MPPPAAGEDRRRLQAYPHHHAYNQHQHQFHAIANTRQRIIGHAGGHAGGGGGPHGEEDFEFLRSILLDAGDGSAAHHATHTGAMRHLGGARYLPVSTLGLNNAAAIAATGANDAAGMTFVPMADVKPTILRPTLPAPGSEGTATVGSILNSANASREYRLGATSPGTTPAAAFDGSGSGGAADRGADYHVTEEEKLEAADDVARCIWLAGDDLRDVLLSRLWEVWSTVMDEMAEEANIDKSAAAAAAAAAAAPDAAGEPSRSPPLPRKRFSEVLVQRLQAVRKAEETELKASKPGGGAEGASARQVNPPPRQWRRGAALRVDVLARLDAYQRSREQARGGGGGGGGGVVLSTMGGGEIRDQRHRGGRALAAATAAARNIAGGSDLKQGLESQLRATREVVKTELHLLGEGDSGRNLPTAPGGERRPATTAPSASGDSAAPSGGKRKKGGGGGGTAAADGTTRKRKRSGNGRRCKHEGW